METNRLKLRGLMAVKDNRTSIAITLDGEGVSLQDIAEYGDFYVTNIDIEIDDVYGTYLDVTISEE